MGVKAADAYSKAIAKKGWPLNEVTCGGPIYTEAMPQAFDFAGLTLRLISPDLDDLTKLYLNWREAMAPVPRPVALPSHTLTPMGKRAMPAKLDPEILCAPSGLDKTLPNGSSIALIAEFDGRSVLLGADAHPDTVLGNLQRLSPDEPLKIDLVKLPHHGSRANLTREILEKLDCTRFAISTSGAVFGHPDPEAISRILKYGPEGSKTLYFNYDSDRTLPWNSPVLKADYGYDCVYPLSNGGSVTIDI
jgi:hypothetical protein